MELDEFVDMEWLNSHSSTMDVKDESFDSADPFYYMDSTFEPDFMSQDIVTDPTLDALDISTVEEPSVKEEAPATLPTPPSTDDKETAKSALPPSFPSTEQIKLLIEAAKKQLALQQQQQEQNGAGLTTVPPAQTQITSPALDNVVDTLPITTVSPDKLIIKQEEDKEPSQEVKPNVTEMASHFTRASSKMDYDSDEEIHSPEDIKKMTPKERRQLRNKISARNFRVRRKEYISTLEAQVQEHKSYADQLFDKLSKVENENICLKAEVDSLRRQNQLLVNSASPPSPPTSSDLVRTASSSSTSSSSSKCISSPRINLNKDISITGSMAIDTYRQDTRILVSNAVMPNWNVEEILKEKPDHTMFNAVAHHIVSTFASFMTMSDGKEKQAWSRCSMDPPSTVSPAYIEYLYDTVIMSSLGESGSDFNWWNVAAC